VKPILVVSKCLGFGRCRYDGGKLSDSTVESLKALVDFIPVCPETGIGLGVPRAPIRIVRGRSRRILYQPATKRDMTVAMRDYCAAFHARLDRVDGYILKARSPSCGPSRVKVFGGLKNKAASAVGVGFFAAAARRFCPGIPIVDEERLKDPLIREHFIDRVFATARLRNRLNKGMTRGFKRPERSPGRQS